MILKRKNFSSDLWPIYKGESFDLWNPDTEIYHAWANPKPVLEWIQNKRINAKRNSAHSEFDQGHLLDQSTLPCFAPRIAFRDITNRTNQRTIIACLVPPKVFITHKGPYFLWPRGDEKDQAFLLGVLCSIPFDWYARLYVETNVTYFLLNSFPVPRPSRDDTRWRRVVELAGRLACPDKRFAEWAKTVGVRHGPLEIEEKGDKIHELDALVAHLYGLSEQQLTHIFKTFHKGWDYHDRLTCVLKHFKNWKSA